MALATSGALTLDQIHVEAGGTTGTTCSLNDSDIRGLTAASGKTINSTLGTTIDFDDFYGASGALTSGTITNGYYQSSTNRYRGLGSEFMVGGSISPSNPVFTGIANGNALEDAYVLYSLNSYRRIFIHFSDTPNSISNTNSSAFTSVTIGSTTLNRSNATFAFYSGYYYRWYWQLSAGTQITDNTSAIEPFGATGATVTISFA